jgi:F0F1-type ATP synthase membrane subunit c/vacuolar-type H+-ATPase subunit K
LEAISRNPDMKGAYFLSAILGLAFAEATAIYALVIAFQLMGK